ncbi:MAG: GNAT family N-acetyltransferase [Candidatus Promineifilaceae bacterium]|nr:GNAT family N-acetyltransferase [Candidatus Promineifilaceae bacterium]
MTVEARDRARGQVRPCQAEETETIWRIINEAAEVYQGIIPADRWHEPYMAREELQRELAAGVVFWGYELGSRLEGVMGIQAVDDVTLIRHVYVRPSRQGQGIGSRLLATLRRQTGRPILIGTWAAADWAIRF